MNGTTVTALWTCGQPSPGQARVLTLVETYCQTFKRPCPAAAVADALGVHRTTITEHFSALYRKGWLRTDGAPAVPRRSFLDRSR